MPEKIFFNFEFLEKCSIRDPSANFCRKVPFWGSYWPLNYFSHIPSNFSRQDASFEHCLKVLITHFFIRVNILIFWFHGYWENYDFRSFLGDSNEKNFVTPTGKNCKKNNLNVLFIILKNSIERCLQFFQKIRKTAKMRVFLKWP